MVYVEHELLVRDFPGTKVGSLENLNGDRGVSPQIPAVDLRAPAEGCIENRWIGWVEFELSFPGMSELFSCRRIWTRVQVESTWDTLFFSSSQPAHISVFSPVDSLKKAMLNIEGVNVPAAKYSVVWSGQNATEEMIPTRKSCNDEVRRRAVGRGTAILTF